jgi:hypothetical protein
VLLQLESLAEYAGKEGLSDEGRLESALARADKPDATRIIFAVASGNIDEDELAAWIKLHSARAPNQVK